MAKATLAPKSIPGESKAYLWVILDHDGKFDAVAHGAKSVSDLLSKSGLSLALIKSKAAFLRQGGVPAIAGKLIDPMTGRPF